ncbi:MAG TPA: hypothetical protein V6C72_02290, partial [Chroococcales cyanobacterium]
LFLTEFAISGILEQLDAPEAAAVLTALVSEDGRVHEAVRARCGPNVDLALAEIHTLGRRLWKTQKDFDVEVPVEFAPTFSGLTEMWARGATWDDIRMSTTFDEGDVVRALRRTLDLCRQYIRGNGMKESVVAVCNRAEALLARDEVKEDF